MRPQTENCTSLQADCCPDKLSSFPCFFNKTWLHTSPSPLPIHRNAKISFMFPTIKSTRPAKRGSCLLPSVCLCCGFLKHEAFNKPVACSISFPLDETLPHDAHTPFPLLMAAVTTHITYPGWRPTPCESPCSKKTDVVIRFLVDCVEASL